jgi:hypothetical protein
MTAYTISIVAGRVAVVFCGFTILLPYVLRRNRVSRILGLAQENAAPYLHRLWPHFWLGYLILAFSIIHAGTVMAAMSHANQAGIWAATVALFLLMLEVMLGLCLKEIHASGRIFLRRLHFWNMATVVTLLAAHLWLNAT